MHQASATARTFRCRKTPVLWPVAMLSSEYATPGCSISSGCFVYPQLALRIEVKSPQRVQAGAAKARRGLVTESPAAASTSGGNARGGESRDESQESRQDSAASILAILTITSSPTVPAIRANSWQTVYGINC